MNDDTLTAMQTEMNLLDLPDEILLLILKKINVVDALCRQSGVHSRLDQLLFDDVYVRELDFLIKSWDNSISPMDDLVIDRVCEQILPHINDKITKLTLEPNAIDRVLRAVDYPKLLSLSLMNFSKKSLIQHLTGDENASRIELMNEQITHLDVHIIDERDNDNDNDELNLLELIVSISKCLIDLTFHQSMKFEDRNVSILEFSSRICSSLIKVDIKLNTFEECLFLFDGRFPSLSHCVVYIHKIFSTSSSIEKREKLSKLKYFSLTSGIATHAYDDLVVPFVQQMSNLEELHLFVTVSKHNIFGVVDGNDLEKKILIHLSQLKRFHFSIYTYLYQLNNEMANENDYPSNDDLQQSFIDNQLGQARSYVHYSSSKDIFRCHVYSYPYRFKTFLRLSSSFRGDIFTHVRTLAINDSFPWDYHFFEKVNQSFPLIEILMMCNYSAQENKSELKKNLEEFPIVTFNRVFALDVSLVHLDYIEQLLFNRYTHLPRLCELEIKYEQLITLTNHFTNDPTQLNSFQVQRLIIKECFVRPRNFSRFFPLL